MFELTKASAYAGFKNFHFKKGPILAPIAYLSNLDLNEKVKQTIIVFDLGKYYLDISIIQINGEKYHIHTERSKEVSAIKFTENVYNHVKSLIKDQYIDSKIFELCEEA